VRAEKAEDGSHTKVIWAIRLRCNQYTCQFDLKKFPFDQQDLFIRISSGWDETKVQFAMSTREEPTRQAFDDFNLPDYSLVGSRIADVHTKDPRDTHLPFRTDISSSNSAARYNSVFLIQNVTRNPEFFVLNLYLPTCLISSSGFTAFVFDVEDFNGRSTVLLLLLLTVVSFKQFIGLNLPRLPYITYMDRYALVSLGLIIVIGIIAAALSTAAMCVDEPTRRPKLCTNVSPSLDFMIVDHADYVCLVVVATLWMAYHLIEGIIIVRARRIDLQEIETARTARMPHAEEKKNEGKSD